MAHIEGLTDRQLTFLSELLVQPTVTAAADAVGIPRRTATRWLASDDFREEYRRQRRELVDVSIARLQQASGQAVQTLVRNLAGEDLQASAHISAAKAILDYAVKAVEIADMQERIERLEAAVDPQRGSGKPALRSVRGSGRGGTAS